ncbi:hypothetical protein PIN31115_02061 [Pandoraea iniqua]|uniref:HTH cro/C1-type domain-containing protein n=1 Tax=Pandoraea iniqua TaxID=2508288 RepID=A0A5E4UJE7_9BURK|nr:hypothetical protein [Pandoraea iniqua]VVE00161.1 hypothetical protein PIN31115_02061 [Pandoraea iniqua]
MKSAKQLIAELRADGVSQSEIARGTRISQPTISRIDNGTSKGTSEANRDAIAQFHASHFSSASSQVAA